MNWSGEIEPAEMAQMRKGRNGKMIAIDADVGNVAQELKRIDKRFHLRFSEEGEYFVVYLREEWEREGSGHLVGTYKELDQRIVKDIQKTYWKWNQPGFSFADELDELEKEKNDKFDYEQRQKMEDLTDRLAHAIRKDLGQDNDRILVTRNPTLPDAS